MPFYLTAGHCVLPTYFPFISISQIFQIYKNNLKVHNISLVILYNFQLLNLLILPKFYSFIIFGKKIQHFSYQITYIGEK